jgi:glutamate racemase
MTTASPAPPRRLLAFDSGIGGLGIVRELRARLPGVPIDYLADTALFPYGEIPDAVLIPRIVSLVGAAIERLRPDAVVVACNTASTLALGELRQTFPTPFVGCVPPIKWAAAESRTRHIGLLATAATVRRPYLLDLQHRFAPDCVLVAHGARTLADIAEDAFRGRPADRNRIAAELDQLFSQPGGDRVDVVGIGCTHYSFLLDPLRLASPRPTLWLDPAGAVARQTQAVLDAIETPATDAAASDPSPGRAWFTAPPPDEAALLDGLGAFGYRRIERFSVPG